MHLMGYHNNYPYLFPLKYITTIPTIYNNFKRRRYAYGLVFLIILINNQTGNNIPHKYEGIIVNSLKTPINIVSISFKYKK